MRKLMAFIKFIGAVNSLGASMFDVMSIHEFDAQLRLRRASFTRSSQKKISVWWKACGSHQRSCLTSYVARK